MTAGSLSNYWGFVEVRSRRVYDQAGATDLALGSTVALHATGALPFASRAAPFSGTSSAAMLDIAALDVSLSADVTLKKTASAGGSFVSLGSRNNGGDALQRPAVLRRRRDGVAEPDGGDGLGRDAAGFLHPAGHVCAGGGAEGAVRGGRCLDDRVADTGLDGGSGADHVAGDRHRRVERAAGAGGLYAGLYASSRATSPSTLRIDDVRLDPVDATP